MNGGDVDEWKKHSEIKKRLAPIADSYIDLPIEQWPKIDINWDLSDEGMRFTLDGINAIQFRNSYPDGLLIRWVKLNELNDALCPYNKRTLTETWEVGFKDKLARVIAWAADGQPLTPIFISLNRALGNKLKLEGGNHRYAMINAKNLASIPVLFNESEKTEIKKLISLGES
tara:strand:- start:273 stop:788 length:516 start_codon:yes stop_codon:yes gene_type:complete